jgi:membrane fusion protein, heavy metal efflux system
MMSSGIRPIRKEWARCIVAGGRMGGGSDCMQLILICFGVSMFTSARSAFVFGSSTAAMFAAIAAVSVQDSGAQTPAPPATMPQTARVPVLGAGANLPLFKSSSDQGGNRMPVMREGAPRLIKKGQLIKIPQGSPLRSELTIATVAAKEIQRTSKLNGSVEADPNRTVQVLPPVAGRIVDLKVQRGDRVAKDQELALVYADLAQAHSADRRVVSAPALPDEPTASDRQIGLQSTLSDAARDCQRAEAEPVGSVARLCAHIMPAEGMQEAQLLSLRAPVAGSLIYVGIRPGAVLPDPSSSIITIADLDTIWVTTSLRKKDMALIATGRPAEIAFIAYPNELFTGEARFISDLLDPDAPSFKVRIELPNPTRRLKPNMFALATFLWPKETVPVIPATALSQKNQRDRVFIEVEEWTFKARPVKVDFLQDDQTAVVSGVNIGERIVVIGGALLEDLP